jgi:hypothetical protein
MLSPTPLDAACAASEISRMRINLEAPQATLAATGDSLESAILSNALLIVSCVFRVETCSMRVVFEAVWQSWYLFPIVSLARKMASERIHASRSFTAHQIVSWI